MSLAIAGDPEVLALIEQLPEHKRQPNLILGAARHLGAPSDSYATFRAWTLAKWAAVAQTVLTRSTQTNEAGRAAVLLPVLGLLDGPLALVEVGASAGLCLYPDRYSYLYDGQRSVHPADGPSPVLLTCTTTGAPPIPHALPEIVFRADIDLNPLDVADEDDLNWLDSLIWPEHDARRTRLRLAAAIACDDRPRLVQADLNDAVTDLVHQAPADTTVFVFHSAVFNYLPTAARTTFEDIVTALPCHWITNEGPAVLPHITDRLATPVEDIGGRFAISLDGRPLALAGGHGHTLDWIG